VADDARLTRIESKVDELGKAFVMLARVEERMVAVIDQHATLRNQHEAIMHGLKEIDDRLKELETASATRSVFFHWADRLGTAMLGAAIAVAVYYLEHTP
jgi:predicted DNA repair protein MutK